MVGFESDPVPGDPVVVRQGGNDYVGVADAIRRCADSLRALDAGGSRGSESVEALLEARDDILSKVEVAEGRYRSAGQALVEYAGALERAQTDSLNALVAAKSAQQDVDEAVARAGRMRESAGEYPEQGDGADDRARYERAAAAADGDAEVARGRVRAQRQVILNAMGERDAAAVKAMNAIDGAGDDGLGDSWWDDWGSKVASWVAAVCDMISAITGVLGLLVCWIPVIGQALAGVLFAISAIAGVVAAIGHALRWWYGEESLVAALVSVVFAVLGGLGLAGMRGTMAGVRSSFANLCALGEKGHEGLVGGIKALGGLRGMAAGYGHNLWMSIKNGWKYLKNFFSKRTPVRFRDGPDIPRPKPTPNDDIKDAFVRGPDGERLAPTDWTLPGNTDNLALHPDHIVPYKRIQRMEGFDRLTEAQRDQVVNWSENFHAISARANQSRQNKSFVQWEGFLGEKGKRGPSGFVYPVEPLVRTEMSRIERLMEERIQYMIDQMLPPKPPAGGGWPYVPFFPGR
ncbi:hypothetical protein BH719_02075 [Pauljensenia hongkongensis]|uniref:Uncharacterized protein n=1 Tax=Pauljensenia hongkongensis TaxID=178339 RepID=A0A1D8B0X3_9ACTO|nr:hypothetical protein BH719_02075 [Pauljensenia hongkongensis]